MAKRNSVWGVGPKIIISMLAYLVLVVYLNETFHRYAVISQQTELARFLGGTLVAVGLVIWIIAGRTIFKMYKAGTLYRGGLYAFCRHPLYANFILILVPGICLLKNSWIVLTTPLFMYLAFRYFIREEERGLIEQFGEAYLQYKREVNAIVPKIRG